MKAFPRADGKFDSSKPDEQGMDLRDYFAAKALDVSIQQTQDFYGIDKAYVATWCYEMADAMMKAREA